MKNFNRQTKGTVPLDLRYKKGKFNPDREYIDAAVDEFLAGGGEITKITEITHGPIIYGHTNSHWFDDGDL